MKITISGRVTRINEIHVYAGSAVEFQIETFNGDLETLMLSDLSFRSTFGLKVNHYQSLVGRKITFKLDYKSGESLKLVDAYLI